MTPPLTASASPRLNRGGGFFWQIRLGLLTKHDVSPIAHTTRK
jgi:hypothetical protein